MRRSNVSYVRDITMRKILTIGQLPTALVAAMVLVGGAPTPISAQENPYDTVVDRTMGQRAFQAQCGRCHGRDAKGAGEAGAPDLTDNIEANTDQALFSVIREGIEGTAMVGISPHASEQTVWQIVTFLNSLSLDPSDYDPPGDVDLGRHVYDTKGTCGTCHRVRGEGGRLGPDLTAIGSRLDPDELRTALTDPDDRVTPRWWTMRVTRADGSVVEGLRMNEDTFTLRIIDKDENLWHFSKREIRSSERIKTSTMPATQNLTASELDDLVTYLFSLQKES